MWNLSMSSHEEEIGNNNKIIVCDQPNSVEKAIPERIIINVCTKKKYLPYSIARLSF
jgi:hypothetical protein